MRKIYHALTLNLHQPPGNLQWLLDNNEWEAKEILWALDRMPRAAHHPLTHQRWWSTILS